MAGVHRQRSQNRKDVLLEERRQRLALGRIELCPADEPDAGGREPRNDLIEEEASVAQRQHGRTFADNRIDWGQPATRIRDFVRACNFPPYPRAFTEIDGIRGDIAKIDVIRERRRPAGAPPGTLIVASSAALLVFAADCAVLAWHQSYSTPSVQLECPATRAGSSRRLIAHTGVDP